MLLRFVSGAMRGARSYKNLHMRIAQARKFAANKLTAHSAILFSSFCLISASLYIGREQVHHWTVSVFLH